MGRKKSYSREEAAESALQVFWEKGYERTSLRDLEAATGVNRFGIYDSFKDKQGLFRECLAHYCSTVEVMIGGFVAEGLDGLLGLIGRFAEADPDDIHLHHGCLAVTSRLEQDGLSAEIRLLLSDYMANVMESIRSVLDTAQKAGKLRPELNIDECVEFVHLCLLGLPTMSRASSDASGMRLAARAAMNTMQSWRT